MLTRRDPEMVFTSLAHRIDLYLLKQSFRKIRKNESTGVDKVSAKEYAENLEENLYNLHQRLRRGQYVATPVRRVWIDKEGGKKRPIGITAVEDKIVQKRRYPSYWRLSMMQISTTSPMHFGKVTVSTKRFLKYGRRV